MKPLLFLALLLVMAGSVSAQEKKVEFSTFQLSDTIYMLRGRGGNVGKKMLNSCNEIGAEFLVVGGFSHTRTRQRLFGGVTSYLLSNTDIITVMAH